MPGSPPTHSHPSFKGSPCQPFCPSKCARPLTSVYLLWICLHCDRGWHFKIHMLKLGWHFALHQGLQHCLLCGLFHRDRRRKCISICYLMVGILCTSCRTHAHSQHPCAVLTPTQSHPPPWNNGTMDCCGLDLEYFPIIHVANTVLHIYFHFSRI